MSCDTSDSSDGDTDISRTKAVKRHGACNRCKISKIKCDGGQPCSACSRRQQRPRGSDQKCEYSAKARLIAAAREERNHMYVSSALQDKIQKIDAPANRNERQHTISRWRGTQRNQSMPTGSTDLPAKTKEHSVYQMSIYNAVRQFAAIKFSNIQAFRRSDRSLPTPPEARSADDEVMLRELWTLHAEDPHPSSPESIVPSGQISNKLRDIQQALMNIKGLAESGYLEQAWIVTGAGLRSLQALASQLESVPRCSIPNAETDTLCLDLLDIDCRLSLLLGRPLAFRSEPVLTRMLYRQQQRSRNWLCQARLAICVAYRTLCVADVNDPDGATEFVRLAHQLQNQKEQHLLYVAAAMAGEDSTEVQLDLVFFANLILIVIGCQAAAIRSSDDLTQKSSILAAEVDDDEISTSDPAERRIQNEEIVRHALLVLAAFHRLRKLDEWQLAHNWMYLYGALAAAELVEVAQAHPDDNCGEHVLQEALYVFQQDWSTLQVLNPTGDIFCKVGDVGRKFNYAIECSVAAPPSPRDSDRNMPRQPSVASVCSLSNADPFEESVATSESSVHTQRTANDRVSSSPQSCEDVCGMLSSNDHSSAITSAFAPLPRRQTSSTPFADNSHSSSISTPVAEQPDITAAECAVAFEVTPYDDDDPAAQVPAEQVWGKSGDADRIPLGAEMHCAPTKPVETYQTWFPALTNVPLASSHVDMQQTKSSLGSQHSEWLQTSCGEMTTANRCHDAYNQTLAAARCQPNLATYPMSQYVGDQQKLHDPMANLFQPVSWAPDVFSQPFSFQPGQLELQRACMGAYSFGYAFGQATSHLRQQNSGPVQALQHDVAPGTNFFAPGRLLNFHSYANTPTEQMWSNPSVYDMSTGLPIIPPAEWQPSGIPTSL